jgi:hypothetical protein
MKQHMGDGLPTQFEQIHFYASIGVEVAINNLPLPHPLVPRVRRRPGQIRRSQPRWNNQL